MEFDTAQFEKLRFTGPVSVSLEHGRITAGSFNILIMGPTGAGKSTFIEAFGLEGGQRISSNGLDGFTQKISTYRMNNITTSMGGSIHLVDSPGFADTKISESAIVSMLKKWLEDYQIYFHKIFYLIPITHVRFPGSQRKVLETFQALTGLRSSSCITIITTMWDQIHGDQALKRAEGTFKQLQDEIWNEHIDSGAAIVRFHNTHQSAISILNEAFQQDRMAFFHIENMVQNSQGFYDTPIGTRIYTDLQDRIQNLQSARSTLRLDLEQAKLERNTKLQSLLIQRLQEGDEDLARFQKEIEDLGPPPSATPVPRPELAISDAIGTNDDGGDLVDQGLPSSNIQDSEPVVPSTITEDAMPQPSPPPRQQSLLLDAVSPASTHVVLDQRPPKEPNQLAQNRLLRVISSMKCWGNSIRERHDDD